MLIDVAIAILTEIFNDSGNVPLRANGMPIDGITFYPGKAMVNIETEDCNDDCE